MDKCGHSGHSIKIVTLTDLNDAYPTLRLRLEAQSTELGKKKHAEDDSAAENRIEKFKAWISRQLSSEAESHIKLEYSRDPVKTKKNKEKLKAYFQKMRDHLDEQENEVLNEMDSMTPLQQEELLYFWQGVQVFVCELIDYLKKTFDFILDKIKTGYTLVKDTVKGFFDSLLNLLKDIF